MATAPVNVDDLQSSLYRRIKWDQVREYRHFCSHRWALQRPLRPDIPPRNLKSIKAASSGGNVPNQELFMAQFLLLEPATSLVIFALASDILSIKKFCCDICVSARKRGAARRCELDRHTPNINCWMADTRISAACKFSLTITPATQPEETASKPAE